VHAVERVVNVGEALTESEPEASIMRGTVRGTPLMHRGTYLSLTQNRLVDDVREVEREVGKSALIAPA